MVAEVSTLRDALVQGVLRVVVVALLLVATWRSEAIGGALLVVFSIILQAAFFRQMFMPPEKGDISGLAFIGFGMSKHSWVYYPVALAIVAPFLTMALPPAISWNPVDLVFATAGGTESARRRLTPSLAGVTRQQFSR